MSTKSKNILILFLTLVLAGVVFVWFYPLDKGKLSVTTGLTDYFVFVGDVTNTCTANPCLLDLKTGLYTIKVQKDEYFPETTQATIARFKTTPLSFNLKKIPTLNPSTVVPSTEPLKSTKAIFWDPADQKIKVTEEQATRVITSISEVGKDFRLIWAPNEILALGIDGQALYFIDTAKASRKKIVLSLIPKAFMWSKNSDFILLNDEQAGLNQITFDQKIINLGRRLDLNSAILSKDGRIFYFVNDADQNRSVIKAFDPTDQMDIEIVSKYNFPISKITQDANGTIYFYNSGEKGWYKLEY